MEIIQIGINQLPTLTKPLSLAVGYFDGFHLGHQALVNKAKQLAQKHDYASAVLSFNPNPLVTLGKLPEDHYLTSLADRARILESMGIDYFLVLDFTIEAANLSPEDFIQYFLIEMNVKEVICGFDFFFGQYGRGNSTFLKQYPKYFNVTTIAQVAMEDKKVSSTRIHELLKVGDIQKANTLLTRPYHISGKVICGKQRGRTMGFPTANVDYGGYYLPHFGVYGVLVKVGNEIYQGMCNIGYNPTFKDIAKPSMEVNIFDFNQDIYGQNISVYFFCFTRSEIAFSSKEQLQEQLEKDCAKIVDYFKAHPNSQEKCF